MKEQFDKRLVEKIKDSFEKHEEAYDPAAWDKLAATYFKHKKGFGIAPWIYWAAAITLLMGLSVLFFNLNDADLHTNENILVQNEDIKELSGTKDMHEEGIKESIKEVIESAPSENSTVKTSEVLLAQITKEKSTDKQLVNPEITVKPSIVNSNTGANDKLDVPANIPDRNSAINKLQDDEQKALAIIDNWLKEASGGEEDRKDKEGKSESSPVKLGLMVIPQATNNSNQTVNLGGGLVSEFSFSKRLKLDVGMAYASQNLNPNNNMFYAMDAVSTEDAGFRTSSLSTNVINSNSELRFGQLEIPINLKYSILEKAKSGVYLMSGLSNMFYLNQRNVNTFEAVNLNMMGLVTSQNAVQQFTETVRPSEESGNATVGQMINFGFGYEHSLNNGTFFSVEPFYKTSLGGQTFWGQQFSIGGINLRMNFQLKNK